MKQFSITGRFYITKPGPTNTVYETTLVSLGKEPQFILDLDADGVDAKSVKKELMDVEVQVKYSMDLCGTLHATDAMSAMAMYKGFMRIKVAKALPEDHEIDDIEVINLSFIGSVPENA